MITGGEDVSYTLDNYRMLKDVEVSEGINFYTLKRNVKRSTAMHSVVKRFVDGRSEKVRVALVKESGVWTINWISEIGVTRRFENYAVSVYSKHRIFTGWWGEFLEIMRGKDRVFEIYMDSNMEIDLSFMGKDITGDGKPNLVIWANLGGSAVNATIYIVQLGQEFRTLARIGQPVKFQDLDRDEKLEIVLFDRGYPFLWRDNASGPRPKVILRYQDGAYRIAVDLMRKPAPPREELERRAKKSREDGRWMGRHWLEWRVVPYSLSVPSLELLYTGHPELAWQFVEMAWPQVISGKDIWLSKFRKNVQESQYLPLDGKRAYFVP